MGLAGLGRAATYLVLFTAAWSALALIGGLKTRRLAWIESGRRAVVATFGLSLIATVALLYALVTNAWHLEYVWRSSLPQQPFMYKIGALWGGMSGSMLFWLDILVLCGALVVWRSRNDEDQLSSYALGVISVVSLFFAVLVAGLVPGVANPFVVLPPHVLAEIEAGERIRGMGLNPLLQTPLMLVHPPALYSGFVLSTVPFAYAFGALVSGAGSSQWITRSRRWTIVAWLLLTFGNLLGGGWAYGELGWGGYWGWDPVENAALLPWLLITAFLHSVMIQEHRNMLKLWNIILISLTFLLILFGTMLVRSGVLSSIHAFGESRELLEYFLGFIVLTAVVVGALVVKRWRQLRSVNQFDSLLSREAAFLLNNWIFLISAVVVLAGTTFPIISEAYYTYFRGIEGKKIAVSEPYYNVFIVPLGIILLVLTGVGPMISWKKATGSNLQRNFMVPSLAGIVAAALFAYPFYRIGAASPSGFPIVRTVYALLCVFASVFVLATVSVEYFKGARVRVRRSGTNWLSAAWQLTFRNKRRYGGYIVHVGVVLFYLGVMGSKGFQVSHRVVLDPGDTYSIAGYTLTVGERFQERGVNATYIGSNVDVSRYGRKIKTMRPSRGYYDNNESATYESAILRRGDGDLYIALGDVSDAGQADMQIYYNPLAWVVLMGGPFVMLIGALVCLAERGRMGTKTKEATA